MAIEIKVKPKTVLVKDIEWSTEEIAELKKLYAGSAFIELHKADIRHSELLQKALKSEAVMATALQKGDKAILHMAKIGYDLMGTL